jgi:hypothetical protein
MSSNSNFANFQVSNSVDFHSQQRTLKPISSLDHALDEKQSAKVSILTPLINPLSKDRFENSPGAPLLPPQSVFNMPQLNKFVVNHNRGSNDYASRNAANMPMTKA